MKSQDILYLTRNNDCNLEELTRSIYDEIFNEILKPNKLRLYRIWNYIPSININDRYKEFCNGRAASFAANSCTNYPASTAVGSLSDKLDVYFIVGTDKDVIQIENPEQMPAYEYPVQDNFQPPSFSRALYCRKTLYISGTASISGHKSLYPGNPELQCLRTVKNIEVLISGNNLNKYGINEDFNLKNLDSIKVYIRNTCDFPLIKHICEENFSQDASIEYINTEICRPELQVEIEGIIK